MNHLQHEISPYLLQHAENPVDWYPWNNDALEKARAENKPILLSIGYSACHWCHVMAHESFEDPEIAALMNKLFINIKVDKEERPDLDKIYQTSHYLLTQQHGGWPLTIFLTPKEHIPFFSGTYFPKEPRYQLPSFKQVLQFVSDTYHSRMSDIKKQNAALVNILLHPNPTISAMRLNEQPLQLAIETLKENFDPIYAGFGEAPKFPQAAKLEFLFAQHSDMAEKTLIAMAQGGIYDQLGGGFYRYSVDQAWQIPHFEKMLYDNGQLLALYANAAKLNPLFERITHETADWLLKQMQSPDGGFYSSIDADSEGQEGKFYVWDKEEVRSLLSANEFIITADYYGLTQPANFEHHWHLHIQQPLSVVAEKHHFSLADAENFLHAAKTKLLAARSQRIPPHTDHKILTAWNALVIKGLLLAGYQLDEEKYLHAAETAIAFIQKHLWKNQKLLASHKDGHSHLSAYLDDYAFLLDTYLTALQISWNSDYLKSAIHLADYLIKHFYDEQGGGFFFTSNHHEKLLYRPKTMMDEAIPSGSSIATRCLLTLHYLTGDLVYAKAVETTLFSAWPALLQYPAEHCSLLFALQTFLKPPQLIILRGEETELKKWHEKLKKLDNFVFAIPNHAEDLPELLAAKTARGKICAYVCEGTKCSPVVIDLKNLI